MALRTLLAMLSVGAALAVCPNDCSSHGACNMYSMCECYRNWMGADCSEHVCKFGLAFVDTPQGDLNADGYVSGTTYESQKANTAAAGGWEIYPWYAGWGGVSYTFDRAPLFYDRSATALGEAEASYGASGTEDGHPVVGGAAMARAGSAQGEAHLYKECSAKGTCSRGSGECACFAGYEGEDCGRTACPDDCSGHGVCTLLGEAEADYDTGRWGAKMTDAAYAAGGLDGTTYTGWDRWKTQYCVCDPGFFGEDCSLRECPKGDDPVTKYVAYTRIKLVDDSTGNTWYDNAACPTGDAVPAATKLVLGACTLLPKKVVGGAAVTGRGRCLVGTAGNGYDADYDKPVATFTGTCVVAPGSTQDIDFGWNGEGVIEKGAYVYFNGLVDSCTAADLAQTTFSPPSAMDIPTDTDATGGHTTLTKKVICSTALGAACTTCVEGYYGPCDASDGDGFCDGNPTSSASGGTCNAVATVLGTSATVLTAYRKAKFNGFRRSLQGLLPARVWTWESWDNALFHQGYVWNAWYSKYDDAADTTAAPASAFNHHKVWSPFDATGYARCAYDQVSSTSCKYNTVKYQTDVSERQSSIANAEVATVTGMASMASGTITDRCCNGDTDYDCTECNFFDVLLKDVSGTFNTGDELRVTWPMLSDSASREADGFALCNYIESISTYYAANAGNYQANEVQVLQVRSQAGSACFDGYFALEFTDEFGDMWTTEAVSITRGVDFTQDDNAGTTSSDSTTGIDDDTATMAQALAGRIEAALEALPNNVVPDVDVTYRPPTTGTGLTDSTSPTSTAALEFEGGETRHFTISFVENSGDIPTLGVAYSVVDTKKGESDCANAFVGTNSQCEGYTRDFRFPKCRCQHAVGGGAITKMDCYDRGHGMDFQPVVTFSTGTAVWKPKLIGGKLAVRYQPVTTGTTPDPGVVGGGAGVSGHDNAWFDCAAAAAGLTFKLPGASTADDKSDDHDFAPDVEGLQTSDYFRSKCVPFDSATGLFAESQSAVGDPTQALVKVIASSDEMLQTGSTAATIAQGTTENAECSNRGICDYSSGTCKCFTGFTTQDCSVQNSLAMG